MKLRYWFLIASVSITFGTGITACSKDELAPIVEQAQRHDRYLYVASGACYAGGVTTAVGTGTVAKFDLLTGAKTTLADYTISPSDMPASVANFDGDNLLVLVENASGRRIDIVNKRGLGRSTYLTNATALNAAMRDIRPLQDGGVLVVKATGIEKFASSLARVTQGANPYVFSPAGSCATSTTAMTGVAELPNGKIVYTHAAATPNNKIGLVKYEGYAAAADCLAGVASPATTALPTAVVYHPLAGDLLVAYGSTTMASNFIYAYDVDQVANTINGATLAYQNSSVLNGPSAMAVDDETGDVYVANANSTYNTIERFTYNDTTKTLTRVGSTQFLGPLVETRCISGLAIGP